MGYSKSQFESICERCYYEKLERAKSEIDVDGKCSWNCYNLNVSAWNCDFQGLDVSHIVNRWRHKLQNDIDDYKRLYAYRKEVEDGLKRTLERQRQEQKQREEELRREEWENSRRQREREEEKRRQQVEKSLKTLKSSPYNMSDSAAMSFIGEDGEIDKLTLTKHLNTIRNKELIEKKNAEWNARKVQQHAPSTYSTRTCPNCGHHKMETDKFCRTCGTILQKVCPSCKKLLPPSNKFCTSCGTKL